MWADAETDIDFLNYSEVAEAIVEIIEDSSMLPLSLGVFGGWGMGKSSILNLVEKELRAAPNDFLVIKFDAWMYQGYDDARAALMSVISSLLFEAVPPTLKDKVKNLLSRVNKLRALGLMLEAGAMLHGVPAFGVISKGVDAIGHAVGDSPESTDVSAIKEAGKEIKDKTSGVLKPAQERGAPEEIDAFRVEFGEVLAGMNKTLVVFIDNLDRCLPRNAIHTLEAIRLFLFLPKTAFVIAADEDMIRHAVSEHFHNPSTRHITDYIDKLIQLPVRVPRSGIQEVRAYLFLLLCSRSGVSPTGIEALRVFLIDHLRQSWKAEGGFSVQDALSAINESSSEELVTLFEMADRIAPILALAPGVLGNPRTVKRMLNVVRMRTSIANRRHMPLDEAMIMKLALFERCTDQNASEELHNIINAAKDGKPKLLRDIESAPSLSGVEDIPDAWRTHVKFLERWSTLPPRLGGVDLRPAVYLARETMPLRNISTGDSTAIVAAVDTLLEVKSIGSSAAKSVTDALQAEEMPRVMNSLIDEMRKDPDWSRPRSDFRGAVVLANRSNEAAEHFSRFIRALQLQKMPAWMNVMLKDKSWWQV